MNKILYYGIFILLFFTILVSNSLCEIPELIGTLNSDTSGAMFGRNIVPIGNQNDDQYDDFLVYHLGRKAFVYFGGDPIDAIPDLIIDSVQYPRNVGDVNGDGYTDISCSRKTIEGRWKIYIYYGGDLLDNQYDVVLGADSLWGSMNATRLNDLNGNGIDEIICKDYNQAELLIYELQIPIDSIPDYAISPANKIKYDDYDGYGDAIITGFFNNDSIPDLAVNLRFNWNDSANGQVWFYWGGIDFDTIPDFIITRPGEYSDGYENNGRLLENLGDINGDGYDDIYVGQGNSYDSLEFIYYCGPDIDTIPEIKLVDNAQKVRSAGDINNDDYNDLLTSYPSSISGLGHVNIHLCNPEMDSIPDFEIWEDDIPEYQNYFGNDVSDVGDVNGDGIDDFAFSAVDGFNKGVVFIYSGWQDPVDVNYEYNPMVPETYELRQNYPNPFNMETKIDIMIPKRAMIKIDILNVIGQKVRTLLNKELSAGKYSISWDGNLSNGNPAPTGVYFYRLSGPDFTQTRRMVLLK